MTMAMRLPSRFSRRAHFREHVLQEEHLPIADARCARFEAPGAPQIRFRHHSGFVDLPFLAIRRISEDVIKAARRGAGHWKACCRRRCFRRLCHLC